MHLDTIEPLEPSHSILRKLLNLRPQLVTLHIKIIYRTYPWDQLSRITATDPVHQRSTDRAEVIGHRIACGDGLVLGEHSKLVLATDVRRSRLVDNEIGCKGGRVDLMVIRAVANEGGDEVGTFDRLQSFSQIN